MNNIEGKDLELCNVDHEAVKGEEQNSRSEKKGEEKLSPWDAYSHKHWSAFFLVSCVVGVAFDPLFLYVPIINEDMKCLTVDNNMKIVALVLRAVTDFIYLAHLIVRFLSASKTASELNLSRTTRFPWINLVIDIFAIIPLPQVIVIIYFSKIAGSRSLTTRKIFNFFLMVQYVPRILRVYLSTEDLQRASDSFTRRVWMKGALNFFLYVMAGHVFGGFWYFFSIYRETACWHHACAKYTHGCDPSSFKCGNPSTNLTFINEFCPVDPTNEKVFDFGIYVDAIGSPILRTTDFLKKFSYCFSWGLRNLSSFGSNLKTSCNTEENLFVVLISILGLLLFLYLIGNIQLYMQLATKKSEKLRLKTMDKKQDISLFLSNDKLPKSKRRLILGSVRRRIKKGEDVDLNSFFSCFEECLEKYKKNSQKNSQMPHQKEKELFAKCVIKAMDEHKKDTKEQKANSWLQDHSIPEETKSNIMQYVKLGKQESKDFDVGILLSVIPSTCGKDVKKELCLHTLEKVPELKGLGEQMFDMIYKYLKPVVFQENTYILREGEPLDFMLFITQGVGWTFSTSSSSSTPMKRLERGNYYGIELLKRVLKVTSSSEFPVSTCNIKSQSKVEAFTLSSIDMETPELYRCLSSIPLHVEEARNGTSTAAVAR